MTKAYNIKNYLTGKHESETFIDLYVSPPLKRNQKKI